MKITQTASKYVRLANCNFAQPQACHNVTSPRCMLFISKALLILAKHNGFQHFRPPHLGIKEAHRRFFRLAEDHCVAPQSAASRNAKSRLDLYVCLRGLQQVHMRNLARSTVAP